MSEGTTYRVEYVIQRRTTDDYDFEDIGFGSSGEWDDIEQAMHMASSAVANYEWETERGHPDPEDIKREIEAGE